MNTKRNTPKFVDDIVLCTSGVLGPAIILIGFISPVLFYFLTGNGVLSFKLFIALSIGILTWALFISTITKMRMIGDGIYDDFLDKMYSESPFPRLLAKVFSK